MLKVGKNRLQISPGIKIGQGVFFSAGQSVQPPAAPVATSATDTDYFDFTANWNASAGAVQYYIDVSTASDFSSFVTGYDNLLVPFGNTSQAVTGLNSNTTYYYRVRAEGVSGTSGNSNTITSSTLAFDLDNETDGLRFATDFRIVVGAYYKANGALATIRRDNDNATETFYPIKSDGYTLTLNSQTSGGTSLSTWIGSNNGFLVNGFDQSGNANNPAQALAADQPQIISVGAFVSESSKPAISLDGSSQSLNAGDSEVFSFTNGAGTDEPITALCVFKLDMVNSTQVLFGKDDGSPNREYAWGYFTGTPEARFFLKSNGGNNQISQDNKEINQDELNQIGAMIYDASEVFSGIQFYQNGAAATMGDPVAGTYTGMANTSAPFTIGKYGAVPSQFKGSFQALYLWAQNKTATISSLSDTINDYYNKY